MSDTTRRDRQTVPNMPSGDSTKTQFKYVGPSQEQGTKMREQKTAAGTNKHHTSTFSRRKHFVLLSGKEG